MGSQAGLSCLLSFSSFSWLVSNSCTTLKASKLPLQIPAHVKHIVATPKHLYLRLPRAIISATLDDKEQSTSTPLLVQEEQLNREVEESVKVLKNAAKTRKVAAEEVLSALSVIEKAEVDTSGFLERLGGNESPGRTWMLIFTSEKQLKGGRYFPLTAVQRFDAAAKRIENGVYLGPIGCLTFEGRLSWKKRILAFIFERIQIKVGPLNPLEISLGKKDDREPGTKDPFFIWFYVDEEIAVARGRGGGTAFWCRCRRVNTGSFI
ncbi:PAP fibrillin domain protein,expressed protein [Quillaja saponaria]|uniref:PAP fibrillin domain protein,expressed protein n=1 Tax=Quillaja saponaria TaxID=32244 RepID=A0AAD7Q5F6_QUISA|nr:PAP fibrillin domain protein,expressed protein [Quillaja saponaria]